MLYLCNRTYILFVSRKFVILEVNNFKTYYGNVRRKIMKLGKVDCWKFHTIGEVKWILSGITKAFDCPNCNKKLDSVGEGRKTKMQ